MYTLEDLEQARSELTVWQRRWDNYSGNNPNKYRSDIKSALAKVKLIEFSLKTQGLLDESKKEDTSS